jgi:glycerophosphodiester phosphodiesterase
MDSGDLFGRIGLHYACMEGKDIIAVDSKEWLSQDSFGKTPLHILVQVSPHVAKDLAIPHEAWKIPDLYGFTPLHLLISKKECSPELLRRIDQSSSAWKSCLEIAVVSGTAALKPFLALAESNEIVKSLLPDMLSISLVWGLEAVALELLQCGVQYHEHTSKVFQQTPLMLASILGNMKLIELLLKNQANVNIQDVFQMTAFDYAIYHGHNEIAELIAAVPQFKLAPCEHSLKAMPFDPPYRRSIVEMGYLLEMHVGTRDKRSNEESLRLVEDNDFYAISIKAENGRCVRFDHATHQLEDDIPVLLLPLGSSISDSFYVHTEKLKDTVVFFDLHSHTPAASGGLETARAALLLDGAFISLWKEQNPLGGRIKLPILGALGKIWGFMIVECTVVKAHTEKYVAEGVSPAATAWSREEVALVGHRGLGMNRTVVKNGRPRLQLGENTIVSLTKGGELGAHYVEFDVQLTRDLVPVLYHDFITSEWGSDTPMSLILSEQLRGKKGKLSRSNSQATLDSSNFTMFNMKPNGAGTIQSPFATLEEALKEVPLSCGFNIEIKYPDLEEAEKEHLHNAEINLFCDRILDVISQCGRQRDILFSSFHPEICFLMCFKQVYFTHQNQYPVFFLTDGGVSQKYDSRLCSLKNAVKFAKSIGCYGIVSNCHPFTQTTHLIPFIRDQGLRVYSYGGQNNSSDIATSQVKAGIDGIIVDDVRDIKMAIMDL